MEKTAAADMSEETCSAEGLNSVLEEYKQSLNDVSQLIRTSQHNTSDQKTGEVSLEHLLKKAEEIQHLLEDGVDITNLLTLLVSWLHFIREILSKNRADPVQSLDASESTVHPVGLTSKEWRGLKRRLNGHASDLEGWFSGIRKKEELGLSTSLTNLDLHESPIACITTCADVGVSPSCTFLEPLVREEENGDLKYTLRCRSAGLFKCKFTSLMFKMERAGEVEYHSVPWENKLESLHCKPAGPLYSISCFPGTPVQIHLPHCEVISDGKQGHLRVAHITGEGLEIIEPKEITESHVVIDVTGLSTFGLITDYLLGRNIRAMVLLFLETSSEPELQVLLLSSNTDTEKVKTQRDKEIHIDRNPYCEINTYRHYSLFTDPPGLTVTPNRAEYVERNPSFLPTFTVLCSTVEEKELTLILKDEKDETTKLWNSVVNIKKYLKLIKKDEKDETKELLNSVVNIEEKDTPDGRQHVSEPYIAAAAGSSQANSESRTKYMIGGQHFIDKHHIWLIDNISSVEPILDRLKSKNVISQVNYTHIRSKSTSSDRMRELFQLGSIRSTTKGKDCLYDVLMEIEPFVMEELKERL